MDDFDSSAIYKMLNTQDERCVVRHEAIDGHLIVDTSKVIDAPWEFETAVSHVEYNPGEWCVVEGYDTEEESRIGHQKWVSKMTTNDAILPSSLIDVYAAEKNISRIFTRQKETFPIEAVIIPRAPSYTREGYVVLEDSSTIMLTEGEDSYFCDRSLLEVLMSFLVGNYRGNKDDFAYPIRLGRLRITVEVIGEGGDE